MTEYLIRLGWPNRVLSPNSRKQRKHREVTEARQNAIQEGWAETMRMVAFIPPDAHLDITFYPPDARRRDLDNCLASIKPHLDGIAKATCLDDSGWTFTLRKGPIKKPGGVVVHVRHPQPVISVPLMGRIS